MKIKVDQIKVVNSVELVSKKDDSLIKKFDSKSALFKHLYEQNVSISEIALLTDNRYQFVYNVIDQSGLPKNDSYQRNVVSKSQMFRNMYDEGKTVGEISKLLNANYNFVHSIIKKHKNVVKKES